MNGESGRNPEGSQALGVHIGKSRHRVEDGLNALLVVEWRCIMKKLPCLLLFLSRFQDHTNFR